MNGSSPASPAGQAFHLRWVNRFLLLVVGGAVPFGLVAQALGMRQVAAIAWAAATLLTLLPLARSVFQSLWKRALGVDLIALLAMCGALVLHEYLAGAVIALMLSGGRSLEDFAQARARRALSALVSRVPRHAHRYEADTIRTVDVDDVQRGDLLLIKPGEVLPVDGVVADAMATLDESALTGEARPVERKRGEKANSGTVNAANAPFRLKATAPAGQSTYAGIIRLVSEAQQSKASLVRLADKYAFLFLPLTLAVAAAAWLVSGDPVRALAVLVVATPCPLILAAPVAIVAGIARAARCGIIIKGGGALELLGRGSTLVLDKTGTVTAGHPVLTNVEAFGSWRPDELLRMAASLDQVSPHVLAGPILRAASEQRLELSFPAEPHEEFGSGIRGIVDGHEVAVGKSAWVLQDNTPPPELRRLQRRLMLEGTSGVFIAINSELAGALILEDPVRRDAPLTLRSLRRTGFRRIALLTGDHEDLARAVGGILGVDEVFAERSPAEKVEAVKAEHASAVTVMVGDGINDAPALAAADVGVAMGARGATAASEAADVVLVVDRLDRLIEAVRIARRSRKIALQSIWAGMALSVAAMGFAAAGLLAPVAGAVLQEVIDVIVILNALRALRGRSQNETAQATAALGEHYQAEHQRLLPGVKRIRQLADRLDQLPPKQSLSELRELHRFLTAEAVPHEEAEEAAIYPIVAKLIGGDDPTAPMYRAHLEIAHQVALLGRLISELPTDGPDAEDTRDLRRILYGLDAILRLHYTQEDEAYLALLDAQLTDR